MNKLMISEEEAKAIFEMSCDDNGFADSECKENSTADNGVIKADNSLNSKDRLRGWEVARSDKRFQSASDAENSWEIISLLFPIIDHLPEIHQLFNFTATPVSSSAVTEQSMKARRVAFSDQVVVFPVDMSPEAMNARKWSLKKKLSKKTMRWRKSSGLGPGYEPFQRIA